MGVSPAGKGGPKRTRPSQEVPPSAPRKLSLAEATSQFQRALSAKLVEAFGAKEAARIDPYVRGVEQDNTVEIHVSVTYLADPRWTKAYEAARVATGIRSEGVIDDRYTGQRVLVPQDAAGRSYRVIRDEPIYGGF
jgi:hypothetical protein